MAVVPKRRGPPRLCAGGLGGPKAEEAPTPMRRGPRGPQSQGGPVTQGGLVTLAGPPWDVSVALCCLC